MLPPGDVRKALLALADPASKMAPLLAYRFVKGELGPGIPSATSCWRL